MAKPAFDPFEALGLPRDAPSTEIKSRYHALARKYHPNRHQGSDEAKATLSEHFHHIHQAWKLLSQADNRRRRVELLNLLELQDDMLSRFVELLDAETPEAPHPEHLEQPPSDLDGHISSDADEDLPNVGLQRRQTNLSRRAHHTDRRSSVDINSPTSPTKKSPRWAQLSKLTNTKLAGKHDRHSKEGDYFTQRRQKLEKLRRKELEAFLDYRDAMVAKFEAEEEAEKQQEQYGQAKWKREYFERAPRASTERMRSFQHFMGAITAFGDHAPRQRNRSTLSYGVMSPVVGPGESSQLLVPDTVVSKGKSLHRRGWSNDISGDQTSSEDDSGEAHGHRNTSPPGHWHRYTKRTSHAKMDTFRRPTNGAMSRPLETSGQPPGPFKLVVRQATELGAIVEGQDSSVEASSRSRSPRPDLSNSLELGKYTMLPSSGTADIFGVLAERRARSVSPDAHRHSPAVPAVTGRETRSPTGDGCQFVTKQVGLAQQQHVPFAHVHMLTREEKAWLLTAEPDTESDPTVLLKRLADLNQSVASKFEVKPDVEELFNFRLIYGTREVTSKQHQSFIALSYRRSIHVERHHHHFTLPLPPDLFQAVWDERQHDSEGLWVDQICIDQESDSERTISMSAMDMVYRSARLIVVVLDDIEELNAHEGELLQDHMDEYAKMTHVAPRQRFRRKQPPYLESHEELYKIVRKMLRSSWFRRAWCRHEMRLAKHHIFLVPCNSPGSWSGRNILRFNGKCIAHLLDLATEVPFESDVESVKPALHAFFRDRSKIYANEGQMRLHHGNFSTVVAEVFAMEAGGDPRIPIEQRLSDARKDKINIVLNTMECGLSLARGVRDPSVHVRDNDCFHDLSLLALAAQDPGALCSVGAPLPITDSVSSWLYIPTVADAGLNNTKTLQRLPDHARFVTDTRGAEHSISIDLKFLKPKPGDRFQPAKDADLLELAHHFIRVCEEKQWGRNRKRYLTHDRKANLLFGPMKEVYVETLTCVFHSGPDWMSDVCQTYSMSRWKVDLEGAHGLLIALKNTFGRWPADAWSERAAGFIMDFVNFLVIRGLPQRQISKPEHWRPFCITTPTGGKVLTFAPTGNNLVCAAIPVALINPDYVHLARLWMLQPKSPSNEGQDTDLVTMHEEWILLGKSVLFSDERSIGTMSSFGGDFKDQQKVYGRPRSMPTRIIRGGGISR